MLQLFSRSDLVISMRLHGAVLAYLLGVPFALNEYHQKCTDFCDDIGQLGHRRWPRLSPHPDPTTLVLGLLSEEPVGFQPSKYVERALRTYLWEDAQLWGSIKPG